MKHIIIGTAGHVDHGKSAIIKALTGTDTDRLKEEKLRGISIDLGFASLPLSSEIIAGVVDVPGHERFLKNMLAGTGGIDIAMLVIAADEAIMPQTREHLAMLELYGIRHGIIAINKIDKVDDEWLELIEEEVKEFVSKTFLKEAPVCRVSAYTGAGIEELRAALAQLADKVPVRDSAAPLRLWIDRSFTIKGYGVVVTGSVLSGNAVIGDNLKLYPSGSEVRVRGLEWHGEKVEQIFAGQRAAVNVAGVDMGEIGRGMTLSTATRGEVSSSWDIQADWQQEVTSGMRVRLHVGTGEFIGRLYAFKDTENKYMRLILEQPLAGGMGDRGIIRMYSPQHLLGGITLIAPSQNSRRLSPNRAALAEAIMKNDIEKAIYHRIAESRQLVSSDEIRRMSGYFPNKLVDKAIERLSSNKQILRFGEQYLAKEVYHSLTVLMSNLLKEYHKAQPERSGIAKEAARQKISLSEKTFEALLADWQQSGAMVAIEGDIALKSHAERHGGFKQELAKKADKVLAELGLTNITLELLAEKFSLPMINAKSAHDTLVRSGELLKVGDFFVYRKTMQYIVEVIHRHFKENSTLTVAELRDLLNTSRKVSLPLLEYLDMHKYTVREGDIRRPGLKIRNLSE